MAADPYVGAARALLGQGLGMGWGDEAEAWVRSRLGQGDYPALVKKIHGEYGQYAKEHPVASTALEFGGGAIPGIAAMFVPGGQAAGAAQLERTTLGALGKMAAQGAVVGGVSGAGSAEDGQRLSGAATGTLAGGALGAALPLALRTTGGAANWLRERLAPTDALAAKRAAEKMTGTMNDAGLKPQDIATTMQTDAGMKVPSVVANANPALADLAEAVAQRTGAGARKVDSTLTAQKVGSKERTYQQAVKALQPGDYYDDLAKLQQDLRTKAAPLYDAAYAKGEVTDPDVLQYLSLPQFKQGMGQAKKLLAAEGRDMDMSRPTVEVLDQTKRGLDSLIEKQTDATTGKVTSLGRVYIQKKNDFLNALDTAVPEYGQARAVYRGDAELADAMRTGLNDFGRMDHEQVIKLVSGMSDGEKDALRTGVVRGLYSKIMDPSNNFNAAQRVIGSPEAQAKLQPLFEDPGKYALFQAAMERESQLFGQANKILGGSQTGKRMQMRDNLEGGDGIGDAITHAVTGGGFTESLTGLAMKAIRSSKMTDQTAAKLADMLMAKDPAQVAAVVKILEDHAAAAVPKAVRATALESGAGTGAAAAVAPAPAAPSDKQDTLEGAPAVHVDGPDIEADIAAEKAAQ